MGKGRKNNGASGTDPRPKEVKERGIAFHNTA